MSYVRANFILPVATAPRPLGCLGCKAGMLPRQYPLNSPYYPRIRPHRKLIHWPVEPIDTPRRRTLRGLGFNWGSLAAGIAAGAGSAAELVQAFKTPKFTMPPSSNAGYTSASQQQLVYPTQPSSLIPGLSNTTLAVGGGLGLLALAMLMRGGK